MVPGTELDSYSARERAWTQLSAEGLWAVHEEFSVNTECLNRQQTILGRALEYVSNVAHHCFGRESRVSIGTAGGVPTISHP